MKSFVRSKLILLLTSFVLMALAIAIPLISTHAHSQAASPTSSLPDAQTATLPPAWFQLAPQGGPPMARVASEGVLAYDQTNNRLIIFGGFGPNNTLLNDTWVLSGADGTTAGPQWTQLNTANTPTPRYNHVGAYDAADNVLIIYSGCTSLCTPIDNSVYVLTNANGLGSSTPTWTQLSTTGGPPTQRDAASAVYDPTSNSLIVFGGDNCCGGRYNDTWVLSNASGLGSGTPTWTQLSTTGGPPPARASHNAVYDPTNNRMIIFGGNDCCGNSLNDTWVLSNANGLGGTPTWTQLSPTGVRPAARGSAGAAFDASADKLIVFGGANASGFLNDIWVLSHANGLGGTPSWKQALPISTSPSPRVQSIVNYRASTHRLVIFSGADTTGDLNETWVLMNIR